MIKQTLYFGSPTYLAIKHNQLTIHVKEVNHEIETTRAIEDIGAMLLDNPQITITHNAIKALQDNKVVIVSCGDNHMPHSIMLPTEGHTQQSERYRWQIEASLPLRKNLWQQTVTAKIKNQAAMLEIADEDSKRLRVLSKRVKSGDSENVEGQAAAYYWSRLFPDFQRDRYGDPPNNLLNYGYAVLRAMIARALVSSGLNCTMGIHHHNKYSAFCLADDIMEPFRPFVDEIVYQMYIEEGIDTFLSTAGKKRLLQLGNVDAYYGKKRRPLMVGMSFTTSSLVDCFAGKRRSIVYPRLE